MYLSRLICNYQAFSQENTTVMFPLWWLHWWNWFEPSRQASRQANRQANRKARMYMYWRHWRNTCYLLLLRFDVLQTAREESIDSIFTMYSISILTEVRINEIQRQWLAWTVLKNIILHLESRVSPPDECKSNINSLFCVWFPPAWVKYLAL